MKSILISGAAEKKSEVVGKDFKIKSLGGNSLVPRSAWRKSLIFMAGYGYSIKNVMIQMGLLVPAGGGT